MSVAVDDYLYCSPFLSVVSLDHLFDQSGGDGQTFDIPDPQPATEVQIDRQRAHDTIHSAVDCLPPRQRAVIRAIFFTGYNVTQTAKMLQISAAAVVKLRTKALKHLINVLAPARETLFG